MLVSVVCDGVRVRVHVYWRTEVVLEAVVLLDWRSPRPLEGLDPGQRVGPGSGGAEAHHGAGGTRGTCWAGRTGRHLLGGRMVMVVATMVSTMISAGISTRVLPVTIIKHGG